jgi:hypothetical protein
MMVLTPQPGALNLLSQEAASLVVDVKTQVLNPGTFLSTGSHLILPPNFIYWGSSISPPSYIK